MIFDTNVLIHLESEIRRNEVGKISSWLQSLKESRMCITPTIAGELCCGKSMSNKESWEKFCAAWEMLSITPETSWIYGQIYRRLASKGSLIGTNDLWIAATALTHKMPIATLNHKEFKRIKELKVVCLQ